MEQREIDHIQKHMHSLIEHTNVTEVLLLRLSAAGILPAPDVEDVRLTLRNEGKVNAACRLYAIVTTRPNSYYILLETFDQMGKSKVAEILREIDLTN